MKRVNRWAAVGVSAVLALSACSVGGGASSGGPVDVTIQASPVADYAALYVGIEHGIFAQHGLSVKPSVGQSGAATVAAVMSGEIAVGGSAVVPLVNASARNVPVRLMAPAGTASEGTQDYIGLVVAGNSAFRSPSDLSRATIAVNGLKSFLELVTRDSIDKAGGNSAETKFLDMPNSEMLRAVQRGQVDAAVMNEPFLSQAKRAGLTVVGFPSKSVSSDLLVSGYFVSDQFAKKNPQTVEKLQGALSEAQDYADHHPDEVRKVLEANSKAAAGSLDAVQLPRFVTSVDKGVVNATIATMERYGFIDHHVTADQFLLAAS